MTVDAATYRERKAQAWRFFRRRHEHSPESAYRRAWGSLDPRVRAAMWDEADIYPMIYTGDALAEL